MHPLQVWEFLHCYKCLRSNCELLVLSCGHLLCPTCSKSQPSPQQLQPGHVICVECNQPMEGRLISPQQVPDDLQMFVMDPTDLMAHVIKVQQFQQQHQQRLLQLLKRKVLQQKETIKQLKVQLNGRHQVMQVHANSATPKLNPFPRMPTGNYNQHIPSNSKPRQRLSMSNLLPSNPPMLTPPVSSLILPQTPSTVRAYQTETPVMQTAPILHPSTNNLRQLQYQPNANPDYSRQLDATVQQSTVQPPLQLTPVRPRSQIRQNSMKWEKRLQANNASGLRASSSIGTTTKRIPVNRSK